MSNSSDKESRIRRAKKTRIRIKGTETKRLSIHRTPRHMYAQVCEPDGSRTLVSASTVEAAAKAQLSNTGNSGAAEFVGRLVAERALALGIDRVAFDRAGFKYHGRVKALADAAREAGLQI